MLEVWELEVCEYRQLRDSLDQLRVMFAFLSTSKMIDNIKQRSREYFWSRKILKILCKKLIYWSGHIETQIPLETWIPSTCV